MRILVLVLILVSISFSSSRSVWRGPEGNLIKLELGSDLMDGKNTHLKGVEVFNEIKELLIKNKYKVIHAMTNNIKNYIGVTINSSYSPSSQKDNPVALVVYWGTKKGGQATTEVQKAIKEISIGLFK